LPSVQTLSKVDKLVFAEDTEGMTDFDRKTFSYSIFRYYYNLTKENFLFCSNFTGEESFLTLVMMFQKVSYFAFGF
jgi:hypothetical protein